MSFQAEQLAALLRQTQQLAELKANALKYGSVKSVEEVNQEHDNSRNSESPKSNHSSSSDKVNKRTKWYNTWPAKDLKYFQGRFFFNSRSFKFI